MPEIEIKTHDEYLDIARDMDVDDVAHLLHDRDKTHNMFARNAERVRNLRANCEKLAKEYSEMLIALQGIRRMLADPRCTLEAIGILVGVALLGRHESAERDADGT